MFEKQYFASKSQAGNLEEQIEYWRQYLEGAPQYLALPTDWPRPALQSLRSAYQAFTLPAELARQLHQLSQHQGVTLFMTLLAAFQTLLARYTSEEDIIIGAPVSGGAQEEYQSSTGSFANMLPIRVQLSGNPQFSELLERVHATVLDVSMHQKVSLETLFAELQMKRDPSYHPLFQVSFNVRENAQQAFQAANFNSTSIPPGMDTIEVDLAIDILDTGELLSGWIKYSADLFDAQTIARLQGHFKTLLSGIVADPHLRLSQLPILTPSEWQQMLVEWNATETTEPLDRCLYELFEDQVERTPDAIALLSQGESITYTEVNRRANQLAHTLWELGVEPDMLVGILLNRGIDFIVTFLAVFKAGGALLPLDLKQPAKLHAQILSQSKSALLVTHTTLESNVIRILGELPKDEHPQILNIDTLPQPGAWDENMSPCSLPSNLAYVMFTSGSTGIPKGVMVEQRGMLNHIYGKLRDLQIGATDIVAQVGPPCFDIVIWQCLAALLVGGRVCVIPDEIVNDPLLLLDVLVQERITVLQLVPALLRALVQVAQTTHPSLRSLRWIVPTGDALPRELCQSWLHLYPTIPLLNTYGSTECSDDQCHYKIDALPQENAPSVMSIGTPIGNLKTYILDKHLQPVPVGVPGELFIGGIGVGRGYLNRHDLTTERFIPDMFSSIPHARLYHTGDRARYRLDGTIEFLGRLDFMVKIRGLRIELDEIDAVLRKHPHVLDSVVIAQKSDKDDEDARLIAYIVAKPKIKQHTNELRAFLQEYLPEYMIPAIFVPLERLPLGVNGKIDRKALPKPEVEVQESKNTFVAPRNAIEKKLATIWTDVIGVEQIGVYDNFFSLGGHSLLAIQLALSIRSTFQIDLPLRRLFEIPTIAAMAVTLAQQISQKTPDQQGEERFDTKFPEIARVPEQGYEPFPLTDLQQAYWVGQTNFFELGNLSAHTYNEFECLDLDIVVAEQALWKLIARHDMLRAIVRSDGNQQVLDRIPPYKIDLIDLRGLASEEQETHLLEVRERMIQCGPRTDQWPLFELVVHQVADNRFRLHLSLSLLLIDARTERTLAREWLRFYHQPDTLLRPLEMTYRDYLHTLRGIEESEIGLRAWEYWKQRLTTLPAAPELPLLIAPQTLKKSSFVRRRASLEPEVWQRLQALAHRFELTPNIVLCTAYAEIIAKWSKTQHFTLNILSSNRLPLHTQVNEIVGNLSTTIPLEIDCRVLHSFVNRCNTVQAQLWDDIEHSQVSGIRFVREAARTQGWSARAALPIVFASGLDLDATTKLPSYSLAIQEVYSALQTPQVFLDHQVQEVADALMLNWDSIDEIFPAGLIETMFEAYCRLLHRLANDETCWHKPLSLVIGGSHLEHLPHITQAATCDHDGLLHTPFLHQASVFPTHPAVITSRRILSYDELLRRSAQVALWLQQQQVRPNTLVAIVMEKGWEQVVAVLGVLEAGAAYLPIDPSLPPERLHYILEHAEASLALTQSWIDRAVDWPGHVQSRCVDLGEPEADALILPATKQKPEDLAYVIYTSGSTGLPKGVAIDHRGAVNTIADMNQRFHVGPDDRILALSALNFDLSVYDIFGSLAAGATIVFPDVSNLREPAHWADLLLRERVTIWNSVPAFMELLTEHLAQRTQQYPLALRLVLLSGDWIPVSLPDRIRSLVPDVQIISLGGATEASIWSILYPIERVDPQWTSIPYGKGMLNQDIYVLDEALEPRPTWVAGNLYIGGIGLAKGYWRDEEKTRAGFIVHPRAGVPLYRTGDIGRYLPDGNIEFLGREDFQVKIQGYRIELGEIEMALSRHPAVKDVVVTARSSKPNGKILVAYVVPCEDQSLVSVDLRDFLQGILPGYMIPGIFVILQQLPLTANGKIDRRALPDPGQPGSSLPGAFIAPRNAAEAQLVRVWESILDIHPISVTDNFFDLGGNSFSALRLMARLRELWGYELPLSALFQGATIEKMALLFGEQDTPFSLSPLIGMQPLGENTPFFCVHPIGGNVLCYADLVRCLGNGQPFYGLEARDLLYQSIEDMAACYINAIRSVQPHGPYRIGGWSMGGVIAFEMAQQLSQREEEVALLVIMDSELPVVDKSIFELDDADMLLRFISDMHGYRLKDLLLSIAEVRKHTSKSQLLSMLDHMRQASIELPDMESEQFKRLFRIFKSNTYALASYIARPYQHKLTCLQAALGRDGQPIDVSAWQKVAREVEVYQLPGNHYTMFKEPHVKLLARQLQSLLDRSLNLAESRGH